MEELKREKREHYMIFFKGDIEPIKISKEGGEELKKEIITNNPQFVNIKENLYKTSEIRSIEYGSEIYFS
jgi:hypothetical protein